MSDYTQAAAFITPFGFHELRVKKGASNVLLSPAQSFEAKEVLTNAQLPGDDVIAAVHAFPTNGEWTIGAGGIPLAAYALMTGRTIATAGLTPTRSNTLPVKQGDIFPYFTIYARAISDDGGGLWIVLYKCKVTEGIGGTFDQGQFRTSQIKGIAVPDVANSNKVWDYVQLETDAALPTT